MAFLTRSKTWIAAVLLVVVSVVVLALFFLPSREANAEQLDELAREMKDLESLARSKELNGAEWIESNRARTQAYQGQLAEVEQFLQEQVGGLDQHFTDPTCPECPVPLEAGIWKLVYEDKMRALAEEVRQAIPSVNGDPVIKKDYASEWPGQAEMFAEEKSYWIQKGIFGALAELNERPGPPVVPVLNNFRFLAQPERLVDPSHAEVFVPVPFSLEVALEFENLPLLLNRLSEDRMLICITNLEMSRGGAGTGGARQRAAARAPARRTGRAAAGAAEAPQEEAGQDADLAAATSKTLVDVTIYGYVLDRPAETPAQAGAAGAGQ